MGSNPEIIFERDNAAEPAIVIRFSRSADLDNPKIKALVEKLGLSTQELAKLINLDFEPLEGLSPESPIYNSRGDKIEDAVTWFADSSVGRVEVADCKLYKEVITGVDDQSLHLKVGATGGFEVIYALEGEATLAFPKKVDPVAAGVYIASLDREEAKLTPGDLAIIPAPTANAWSMVGEGFKFRYICQPAWSLDFVEPALDQ